MAPKLRFPGFYEKQLKIKIGELDTLVVAGGTPSTKKSNFWGGDIRWMNSGELNLKRVYEVKNRITKEGLEKSSTKVIPAESVLIGLAGQGKTRGTVAMNFVELCINQSIAAIQPSPNFISEYLYYELDRRYEELRRLSTGDGGRGGLNLKIIRALSCILPEKNEQQKIASFLSSVDNKISQLEKKKTLLETYKSGIMQKIFSQELRFKDENGQEFPDWEEKKVEEIFKVTRGYVLSKKQMSLVKTEIFKYPVYSSQTTNGGIIGYFNEFLYKNALTWTTDGAKAGEVNFRKDEFYCTNVCGVLISEDGYANNCISEILNKITPKHVSYVGNPKLMNNVMQKIKLKVPPLKEQQKIASFLSSIDNKIEITSTQLEKTREFKKGLLQQMFI